jgi:hypothetical protein
MLKLELLMLIFLVLHTEVKYMVVAAGRAVPGGVEPPCEGPQSPHAPPGVRLAPPAFCPTKSILMLVHDITIEGSLADLVNKKVISIELIRDSYEGAEIKFANALLDAGISCYPQQTRQIVVLHRIEERP